MKELTFTNEMTPEYAHIFTAEANNFVATLAEEFAPRVKALLDARKEKQAEIDAGKLPDFLPETKNP